MTLESGDLIRGRYRITHRLSDTSYRAADTSLRQACLIKEFSGTTSERVSQLASLQHPHLPRVTDWVREGEQTLLVMDLVEGVPLSEWLLQADEPVPVETIGVWLTQLAETLEYLHRQEPPVAHGDVLIDHVVIQPDGSTAFTNFSSYSRNPTDDIKNFGIIVGYLVSHTPPTVSVDQMVLALTGRTDVVSQTALQMIAGEVAEIDDDLRGRLAPNSSSPMADADEVPTAPLTGRIANASSDNELEPESAGADRPIMPWDQDNETETVMWGGRSSTPEKHDRPEPTEPPSSVADNGSTPSPETSYLVTEVIDPTSATSGLLKEVDAYAHKPASGEPADFSEDANGLNQDTGSGFNWMWIIVGIMAGVILLCLACFGLSLYLANESEARSAAKTFSSQSADSAPDLRALSINLPLDFETIYWEADAQKRHLQPIIFMTNGGCDELRIHPCPVTAFDTMGVVNGPYAFTSASYQL